MSHRPFTTSYGKLGTRQQQIPFTFFSRLYTQFPFRGCLVALVYMLCFSQARDLPCSCLLAAPNFPDPVRQQETYSAEIAPLAVQCRPHGPRELADCVAEPPSHTEKGGERRGACVKEQPDMLRDTTIQSTAPVPPVRALHTHTLHSATLAF